MKPHKNRGMRSARRDFLKATGVALVGTLAARVSAQDAAPAPAPAPKGCVFNQLPEGFVYLNNGTEGTMPDCVQETLQTNLVKWASDPTTSYETDEVLGKRQVLNRTLAGEFLGVGVDNVCLTDNTTMGLNMTILGIDFAAGDRIVMTNHEHNAIISPLLVLKDRVGIEIVERSFPETGELRNMTTAQLMEALFPDTPALSGAKALCVSHVYPTTGVRLPLGELRKKADELNIRYLILDGAQAMGMIDLTAAPESIQHCDFYACAGHKWLNGPPSTGVLYVKDQAIQPPEFYPMLSQRMGQYVEGGSEGGDPFPMVEALQVRGCSNTPGFAAMIRAMLNVTDAGGSAKVEEHILGLSEQVKAIILDQAPASIITPHKDAALLSGLTSFYPFRWDQPNVLYRDKETAEWVVSELLSRDIQVRSIDLDDAGTKSYAIRVSTGLFNTSSDVQAFADALPDVLGNLPQA